ncbi:hypothetical protein [Enterocloster clostridioformis]|jgi:hypothetical protein|uniref:Uncharacterized protein n=1 Tax=Enterocloster clostridioformis TaxID=1531 RepID=A0A829VZA1_9FIRM|nr:hypothetical protein [Enterocloster clostridioformis]ENZ28706.1 hypothetical protein HMPREF1087_01200 [[Clostridium] clostridioforme 90A1]ENZ72471.1 hypothetical protein HMPREF1081_00888 [[Clostridium] clostridioforme 90A4]GEA37579.1 hypothetical protein Ccl03g_32920 [Enterocloster clostridioformis]
MDIGKMKESLIDYFSYEMRKRGNRDYQIDNIRIFDSDVKQYAFADIKYTWCLNCWDKAVEHKDMIFVMCEAFGFCEWKSPLLV